MNPANSSPFRQAEERYFSLRGQLDTGRITRAQFDAALADLMLRDAQGRYWAIGGDSGRWNVFQAGVWVEATPEGETPPALPPPSLPGARALTPTAPSFSSPPVPLASSAPPAPVYAQPPSPVNAQPPARVPSQPPSPVNAQPPAAPARAAPAKSGGGCGRTLGCSCLLLIVLLLACVGGAYWAYTSKLVTQATILNLAGLGPARIEVDNFSDGPIKVSFSQTNAAKGSTPAEGAIELNAFDVKAFHTPNAAIFQINFVSSVGGKSLGTCTLDVHSGDAFQFVTLPDKIVINHINNPPRTGSDLVVSSSSLCR